MSRTLFALGAALTLALGGISAAIAAPALSFMLADAIPQAGAARSASPQIFVEDPNAQIETDDRGIVHDAGVRAIGPDDQPLLEAYNGHADALGFTLEKWHAATGTAELSKASDTGSHVVVSLRHLIAFSRYSLFLVPANGDRTIYTPLDGTGTTNSFDTDVEGTADVTVATQQPLPSGTAIVVVYHSDDLDYGKQPGTFGITAHQQLIVRVP